MSHSTEVFRSLLSSTLQQGRGIASKGHSNRPQQPLELYDMEGCPFCSLVREAPIWTWMQWSSLPQGGDRYRPLVERLGGKQQFPYLMDPNTGEALYESAAIIDYLYQQYGGRPAPKAGNAPAHRRRSGRFCPRGSHGIRCLDSQAPKKPLELYSSKPAPLPAWSVND